MAVLFTECRIFTYVWCLDTSEELNNKTWLKRILKEGTRELLLLQKQWLSVEGRPLPHPHPHLHPHCSPAASIISMHLWHFKSEWSSFWNAVLLTVYWFRMLAPTSHLWNVGERVPDKPGTGLLKCVRVWQSEVVERKMGWSWIVLSSVLTIWTGRSSWSTESKWLSEMFNSREHGVKW